MRNVRRVLSNYSADLYGVCSALYELDGLCVMHDASGCNSTYNTHDEPRWYDIDSMVYVSWLTETDAIMGSDQRLIDDVCETAEMAHPRFIALSGSPMPYMLGTDFQGIARVIEKRTGIPSFGFKTNGMRPYVRGAADAYLAVADRFCTGRTPRKPGSRLAVNLIGVTPLDFSIVGNAEALRKIYEEAGFDVLSCWSMGDSLDDLSHAGNADVTAVVSSTGLKAARLLEERFGIPYITGIPVGKNYSERLLEQTRKLAENFRSGKNAGNAAPAADPHIRFSQKPEGKRTWIIGEAVNSASLRHCLEQDLGVDDVSVVCPTGSHGGVLRPGDLMFDEEDRFEDLLNENARMVIADPFYSRLLPENSPVKFIEFPHEAFSGRFYHDRMPVFIGPDFLNWLRARI